MGPERPHPGWWVTIPGGLGLTALLALDPDVYAFWAAHVTRALSRPSVQTIGAIAALQHLGEALYAARLAETIGEPAGGWFVQTLVLGFPSLRLLLRRARGR